MSLKLKNVAVAGVLSFALLQAQPRASDAKLFSQVDTALGAKPGAVIADIGTGYAVMHPIRIAGKVGPEGKVVCVDVKASVLTKIRQQAEAEHLTNIEAVLGKDDDPSLATGAFDAILISNTYHEFTQPVAMLQHIREALKPGGCLVVVENYTEAERDKSREEQTKHHNMDPGVLERELSAAGFAVKERIDPILVEGERVRYLFKAEKSGNSDR